MQDYNYIIECIKHGECSSDVLASILDIYKQNKFKELQDYAKEHSIIIEVHEKSSWFRRITNLLTVIVACYLDVVLALQIAITLSFINCCLVKKKLTLSIIHQRHKDV